MPVLFSDEGLFGFFLTLKNMSIIYNFTNFQGKDYRYHVDSNLHILNAELADC